MLSMFRIAIEMLLSRRMKWLYGLLKAQDDLIKVQEGLIERYKRKERELLRVEESPGVVGPGMAWPHHLSS